MSRKSIALYYFVNSETPCALQPTHYVPRPDDPFRTRALMRLDSMLLYVYSLLKRYTPLNDSTVSGLLRRLWRDPPPEHRSP
jgi:hypothetical protein